MAWIPVPGAEHMDDNRAIEFAAPDRKLAICRAEGEYYAIDDLCTHDGGPLGAGTIEDCRIECPRHGAQFDIRTGRAVRLPAVRGVKTYPTRLSDGKVEVEVP